MFMTDETKRKDMWSSSHGFNCEFPDHFEIMKFIPICNNYKTYKEMESF